MFRRKEYNIARIEYKLDNLNFLNRFSKIDQVFFDLLTLTLLIICTLDRNSLATSSVI